MTRVPRGKGTNRKPVLRRGISVADFKAYYWSMADLTDFAKRLGLSSHGNKPDLSARIERRLRRLPDEQSLQQRPTGPRDSDKTLRPETRVVNYKSDDGTRAFFERNIGPHFHFTYHLNQYRLANRNLTYGDLIREWVAEYERRQDPKYRAPIASHGEYNRYIRDYFSDERNKGKTLRDAVASWNAAKRGRGDRRYRTQEN
jgi:SAP domain-containing new25/Domain of unknown function (DUF6434)